MDGGIILWKEDLKRRVLWPCVFSTIIQPFSMRNFNDIKKSLQGLINHWEQ